MTNDQYFYQQLRGILKRESIVMATIVKVNGSAPREVGAKMAVCADGNIIGTIGGGAGEGKVIEQALTIFSTGKKQLVEIDLTGTPGKDIQGVCGGKVQVWLETWSGKVAMPSAGVAIALVEQILELFKTAQSAKLITPFKDNTQPYLIADRDFPQKINNFFLQHGHSAECPYDSAQFIETIQPPPILLIVGGGHVAVALAQIAHFAGFQIAVQDDRSEFITPQRFAQATFLFSSIDEALSRLATHSQIYIALVTRGYSQDIEALQAILHRSLAYQYIGAIGSQKRIRMIHQELERQGISIEKLSNFYAPIGLDIGALTPQEIAVSICGELIKVRRGGTGLSICDRVQYSRSKKVHIGELLYAKLQ